MWENERIEDRFGRDPLGKEIAKLRRLSGDETHELLPEVVADSWKRCLADYNLRPDRVPRAAVLARSEMRSLTDTYEELLAIAGPEVNRLFQRLVDSEYLVSFASPQGAMLLFRCDHKYLSDMSKFGVLPGSVWAEEQQGTNGVGTCLREGKAVTIVGNQHYGKAIRSLTCITAPVRGSSNAIQGVFNVTTWRSPDGRTNRLVQNIVERVARRVESRYFGQIHQRRVLLRISEDVESTDLAEEGRLALDDACRIIAGSSHVSALIGRSVEELIGMAADEVFETDVPLCNIRPERPIRLTINGKTIQAILTVPESPDAPPLSSVHPAIPTRLFGNTAQPLARRSNLAEIELRIDPMTAMALDKAQRLLQAGVPLVIVGESGSGKTTFAQAIALRCNADDPIFVDCAALAGQSLTSVVLRGKLFHDRTCLILDRLDELDEGAQKALLTLLENDLQSRQDRLGVIALAALNLDQMGKAGRLRADLLHRLKGGSIVLPPLRHNPDLEGVIGDLLKIEMAALGKSGLSLDNEARLILLKYHWPGNLRELRNALRHAAILADDKIIRLEHLPEDVVSEIARKDLTARSQSEASRIESALRHNGGNVSLTARYLGISRATLYRKIQIQKTRKSAQNSSKD